MSHLRPASTVLPITGLGIHRKEINQQSTVVHRRAHPAGVSCKIASEFEGKPCLVTSDIMHTRFCKFI